MFTLVNAFIFDIVFVCILFLFILIGIVFIVIHLQRREIHAFYGKLESIRDNTKNLSDQIRELEIKLSNNNDKIQMKISEEEQKKNDSTKSEVFDDFNESLFPSNIVNEVKMYNNYVSKLSPSLKIKSIKKEDEWLLKVMNTVSQYKIREINQDLNDEEKTFFAWLLYVLKTNNIYAMESVLKKAFDTSSMEVIAGSPMAGIVSDIKSWGFKAQNNYFSRKFMVITKNIM